MNLDILPVGDAPAALEFPHFPTHYQAVIWRNWNLIPPARLAKVLKTTEEKVVACGEAMGLTRDDSLLERWMDRGFQTIIRRNWELLDYGQLLELLDWPADKLAFTLKEDDFFFHKLGLHKPVCGTVAYRELTADEAARTAQIRATVQKVMSSLPPAAEKPFQFLENYGHLLPYPKDERANAFKFKFIYSYSALYGDALVDDELASYPEALFADYEASGVDGVWLQGILYKLVPWLGDDLEASRGWEQRLRNLKKLSERAGRHNVKLYLYLNEPRSMPPAFFEKHPDWRGIAGPENDFAVCTSAPGVLEALRDGIERLARAVPQLGGIFNITQSENLTHCKSRSLADTNSTLSEFGCSRCRTKTHAQLISEVNKAFYEGLQRAGTGVRLITYAWAWQPAWLDEIIGNLGEGVSVMSVSESLMPTNVFGVQSNVRDYTISKVGPGEVSRHIWELARAHGRSCVAKIQTNVSWELSAMPYLPVPDLVERHLKNLRECGVDGLMLGWTHGGAPGGNLPLLNCSKERLAQFLFGDDCQQSVLKAWSIFSDSFEKYFPIWGCTPLYQAPQNYGPVNLLYTKPTGRKATMIGFPFDDLPGWRGGHRPPNDKGPFKLGEDGIPEDLFQKSFDLLGSEWQRGLDILTALPKPADARQAANLAELITIADACRCHFQATANQIAFVRARKAGRLDKAVVQKERNEAIRLLELFHRDSRLGYEASNHYYYTENDLLEKVLNCDWVMAQ